MTCVDQGQEVNFPAAGLNHCEENSYVRHRWTEIQQCNTVAKNPADYNDEAAQLPQARSSPFTVSMFINIILFKVLGPYE